MCALRSGSGVLDVVGPLGQPSELEGFKQVVCIGGGLGIAPVYPIARAFKEQGTKVVSIIGARNREFMFWEDMIRRGSGKRNKRNRAVLEQEEREARKKALREAKGIGSPCRYSYHGA